MVQAVGHAPQQELRSLCSFSRRAKSASPLLRMATADIAVYAFRRRVGTARAAPGGRIVFAIAKTSMTDCHDRFLVGARSPGRYPTLP
jgi:hypothetical protein